ncbi:hypothetical protein BC827DRAFT_468134 [Russula dissimulans]|nr:hypothetical protein BC827DRAFT_468134 [Russula dissimulans]
MPTPNPTPLCAHPMSKQTHSAIPLGQSSSSQYSNSSQRRRGSSPSRARSPSESPVLDDRDKLKSFINRWLEGTDSADGPERPVNRRCDVALDAVGSEITLHVFDNRKEVSPTQPGRGIRKIIDLYHDLPDLVDKARSYAGKNRFSSEDIDEDGGNEFWGMTEEEIDSEREHRDRKRCHVAPKLLNKLIPGFEEKATAADSETLSSFCAPLQTGANDARSSDTSTLKVAVAESADSEWPNSRKTSSGTRPLGSKAKERGISNDITGPPPLPNRLQLGRSGNSCETAGCCSWV